MSKPLVVIIPHRLGKEEAVRRLKSGLAKGRTNFGHMLTIQEETWTDDRLDFKVTSVGQSIAGTIDVGPDQARVEVVLPWLLQMLADKVRPLIEKQGHLMLEKK